MGALTRVKRDIKGEQIMLPVNVEGVTDNEGISVKQGIAIGSIIFIGVVYYLWFREKPAASSWQGWMLHIAIYLFITQFIVRKFIVDEKYLMKQVMEMEKMTNCSPTVTWNIAAIDSSNGVMQFNDGRVAIAVGLEQATIVGREEQFKDVHYSAISDFIRVLNQQNIMWIHIDLMANAKYDKRLTVLNDTVNKCKNDGIKNSTRMHLGYLRSMEIRTLYETEYYILVASPLQGANKLLAAVDEALGCLEDAAFNKFTVLDKDMIYKLAAELSGVNYFDAGETMRQMARNSTAIKHVLNIKSIAVHSKLKNSLIDEQRRQSIDDTELIESGVRIINVDITMQARITNGVASMNNKHTKMHSGGIEEALIGDKSRIMNAKIEEENRNKNNKNNGETAEQQLDRIEGYIGFGAEEYVDIEQVAASDIDEAAKINAKLGKEKENSKYEKKKAKKRKLDEVNADYERKRQEEKEISDAEITAINEEEERVRLEEASKIDDSELFD